MTTNHSYHKSNFVLTARRELIENRKGIMIGVGSCWGLCMLLGITLGIFHIGGGANEVFFFFFLFSIISSIAGSLMFANMKTKEGRISTLLLPSTAFDKYLVRWLAIVPGLVIIFFIGFYIGDITRIIVSWVMHDDMGNNYYKITNFWSIVCCAFGNSSISFLISTLIICGYFFSQALYIFGAILWPKLSYIKTLLALWALQMIITSGFIFIKGIFNFSLLALSEIQIISLLWCIVVVLILLTLTLYYLTYLRFKRSEVVYKLF